MDFVTSILEDLNSSMLAHILCNIIDQTFIPMQHNRPSMKGDISLKNDTQCPWGSISELHKDHQALLKSESNKVSSTFILIVFPPL